MSELDAKTLERYVTAWHDVALTTGMSAAVASESDDYSELTEPLSADLQFDDEPSDFRHALAGRRGWRGRTR